MGFRDLYSFNKALLAKQAWQIWQNPNSLLNRLYKGRYHHLSTLLQSSNTKQASYGWKSIQVGNELLRKGLRTMIGDGKKTNVWMDHWIPVVPPKRAIQVSYNRNMKVEEFIDHDTSTRNVQKLQLYLQPIDVEQVLKIKLSRFAREDHLIWPFTKDMQYTVKSGYWTATHYYHEGDEILRPEGSLEIKGKIWKLNILPKIKQFLWRVISGALATYTNLCTRGINIDPTCQRCCLEDESINHVLFLCPHATAIWRCSGIISVHLFSKTLEDNIQLLFSIMESLPDLELNKLLIF